MTMEALPLTQNSTLLAHFQTCPLHRDEKGIFCSARLKNGGKCTHKSMQFRQPGMMPTCKTHHRQAKYATYCRTSIFCGFECGRLCELRIHGFQSCEVHRTAPRKCYFLKIPLEIRFQIYGYLFPEDTVPARFEFDNVYPQSFLQRTAILRANRQIHDEATQQLYGSTSFTVEVYLSGLMMCDVLEGYRKSDPRYDGTVMAVQPHAVDMGLRRHLSQKKQRQRVQRQLAAQYSMNQVVQASSVVSVLSPMISGSNHHQVMQHTHHQAAQMGVNLNIPQLQTAVQQQMQSSVQQYSQPQLQQLSIQQQHTMLQQVAVQQAAAAQLAMNQANANTHPQPSTGIPMMPNFAQQGYLPQPQSQQPVFQMNPQQVMRQQAMAQQQQQQLAAQAAARQQFSSSSPRKLKRDCAEPHQPPATRVRTNEVFSTPQDSAQGDSNLDPKSLWMPPLSFKNFNMVNSFTVEIILPFSADIAFIHSNGLNGMQQMGIMPRSLQSAGVDSHLYDYCDHLHKIVRRLRLSPRPISKLDIVIRCGSSYIGRQSWHEELVSVIELMLQTFKYLTVRNANIREITYECANDPLYNENSLFTELEKDSVQQARLNSFLTTWKQTLTAPCPPPVYPPIYSAYQQVEQLLTGIVKNQLYKYSKFGDFPDLLYAAKVAREANNMAGFKAVWQRVVNIWFEYLGEQDRFRAKMARGINGVYAVLKRGDEDGDGDADEDGVTGIIGVGEKGPIVLD